MILGTDAGIGIFTKKIYNLQSQTYGIHYVDLEDFTTSQLSI